MVGINAVRAALAGGSVLELWLDRARRDRRLGDLVEQARTLGVPIRQQLRAQLDEAATGANHQGVLAWCETPAALTEADLNCLLDGCQQLRDQSDTGETVTGSADPLLLVLDGVTDPHNLGACLRCADGAGALAVIAPRDRAAGLTPTAIKVASGAAASLPFVQVTNLARTLAGLRERGIWVIGLAGESDQSLYELKLTGPLALVLGGEGRGLRRLTRERCDLLVALPLRGQVESLNVSVSAGISLYEALRQRLASAAMTSGEGMS